ncbi:diacylglycerol/lipid kinase family protein [Brevibacterium litoralis]|uniref:diacylglycerol/lipid kinase family protein n=1 Tax=Brevibacterium litoralis TaxID=3138935 RepID=UPI0032ED0B7E
MGENGRNASLRSVGSGLRIGSVLLLINPKSLTPLQARLHAASLGSHVEDALPDADITIVESESLAHAVETVAEFGERVVGENVAGESLVILYGGDGFIGAMAHHVRMTGALLLPLSGGRGNDIVRWFGLGMSPEKALRRLGASGYREIGVDVPRVTCGDGSVHHFLSTCTIGFEGAALHHAEVLGERGVRLGRWSYVAGGIRAVLHRTSPRFRVSMRAASTRLGRLSTAEDGSQGPDRSRAFHGWVATVCNTGVYGGGLWTCPGADAGDGALDVLTIGEIGIPRALQWFAGALARVRPMIRGVDQTRTRTVRIDADPRDVPETRVWADGEPLGPLPAHVEVEEDLPQLRLLVP